MIRKSFFSYIMMLSLTILIYGQEGGNRDSWEIPVVVVKYLPVNGDTIDIEATGDWGRSLAFTRHKTDSITQRLVSFLEETSRFRVYNNPDAKPSLTYRIDTTYEFLEPLPTKSHFFLEKHR